MKLNSASKALIAGVSGTALQWYDFTIFGYFAPIIATTFFPNSNHFIALLSAFGVFAVGYLLAPLGSIFFGYIGDRHGRKKALTLSILTMTIPTALISITPGYSMIGIAAPILLTLLRTLQGFVASAEFTGSAVFLVEHARPGERAFYGCLTSSAYSIGSILAGLSATLFTASFMPHWGWRLGFSVALIAGILIFFLRIHVAETPTYQTIQPNDKPKWPLFTACKETPLAIFGVIGIAWLTGVMTFGTYVFTATYLHYYFHFSFSTAAFLITISLLVDAVLEPFIALFAEKIGYLRIIQTGMVSMMLLSVPIFYLLSTGNTLLTAIGLIMMSILIAITYAPLNAYMLLLFPKQYRYSGFSTAFNFGISLFGGTAPLMMLWLVEKTGNYIAPSWYYILGTMIGLCSLMLCENNRQKIDNLQVDSNLSEIPSQ